MEKVNFLNLQKFNLKPSEVTSTRGSTRLLQSLSPSPSDFVYSKRASVYSEGGKGASGPRVCLCLCGSTRAMRVSQEGDEPCAPTTPPLPAARSLPFLPRCKHSLACCRRWRKASESKLAKSCKRSLSFTPSPSPSLLSLFHSLSLSHSWGNQRGREGLEKPEGEGERDWRNRVEPHKHTRGPCVMVVCIVVHTTIVWSHTSTRVARV
jgi:hypothetical protein